LYLTVNYKYDLKRNPIEISAKSREGKMAFVSKSTYNDKGKELTRKVKAKKNFSPSDSILKLTVIPVYDSIGHLISEGLIIKKMNKQLVKKTLKYSYNSKNKLIGLAEFDEKGKQVCREEREYQYSRNRLSLINYYDSSNNLFKLVTKRYEIYRSTKRDVREIEY